MMRVKMKRLLRQVSTMLSATPHVSYWTILLIWTPHFLSRTSMTPSMFLIQMTSVNSNQIKSKKISREGAARPSFLAILKRESIDLRHRNSTAKMKQLKKKHMRKKRERRGEALSDHHIALIKIDLTNSVAMLKISLSTNATQKSFVRTNRQKNRSRIWQGWLVRKAKMTSMSSSIIRPSY